MTIIYHERPTDSPYIASITYGHTEGDGSTIRPAESHWHMVFTRWQGKFLPIFTAPLTSSGVVSWWDGAEILWLKFKLGTFMPHMPTRKFLDMSTDLPASAGRGFWLKDSVWEFPTHENVETFVNRLVRSEILMFDPLVSAAMQDQPLDAAPRTVRHRFLRATGQTQRHIRQIERARQAENLLRQGYSILDTVFELGYFDQPHLTRALRHWVGYTPAQIVQSIRPEDCHSVQDGVVRPDYAIEVIAEAG